ncbi:hypothetical protein [Streptomyces sp. TP-A0874]|uniref:hypothetical protein n=1 Tax=Streptomyces sp. TP-A0874 TaxID=549819 RepID=UPI000852B435|nr:hypothetical protein [Streptomyces sp. TP-A0874]
MPPSQPHYRWAGEHTAGRPSALVALLRSWAVGLAVLLGLQYLLRQGISQQFGAAEHADDTGWRLFLLQLPTMACALLATLAAARVHPSPHRERPSSHLVACLTAPIATRGVVMTLRWEESAVGGIVAPTVAVLFGCVIAVVVDMSMDGRG